MYIINTGIWPLFFNIFSVTAWSIKNKFYVERGYEFIWKGGMSLLKQSWLHSQDGHNADIWPKPLERSTHFFLNVTVFLAGNSSSLTDTLSPSE